MLDLAIYGAGGLGREMALLIRQLNQVQIQWNLVGFYDDNHSLNQKVDEELKIIGGIAELNQVKKPLSLLVAIADPMIRKSVVSKITAEKIDFPVILHPNVSGSPINKFGKGCVITAGCILTTGIQLGDFVIINLATTIGHDVRIGSFSSVMPGCNISGNVSIGENTLLGTGAKILQSLTIGQGCRIGAGAVVTRNFGNNLTVVGVPARPKN
jgi:sugar O-acyltransferase (sialic acid O-acetyltransferase NeuD family)